MRTTIEIDDDLLRDAQAASGLGTKRAVVEEGLRLVVRKRAMDELRGLRGKIEFWDGYDPEEGDEPRDFE
ncbi:MAG TPA: type II toxin-antitoxin system VapB family antitoxin [Tepidiformaceae bacterium]|nr:type II toxin-antitoxin system VapB family antitoxin [Tepidiformaceae bacterium]